MNVNDHSARDHALLSASSAHRWMPCPASARLAARYPAQDTPFTREGTKAHEVAELIASHAGEKISVIEHELLNYDPDMIRHGADYSAYIESLKGPDTTMLLEKRVNFSDWVPEGFGTADCILLHPDGCMDVIDYKYGQGVEVDATENPQMMLYGLGAISDYGFCFDVNRLRLHIFQPRKSHISVYELTVGELFAFGEKARAHAAEALSDNPSMRAGDHCRFCPHAGHCPELAGQCISAVSSGNDIAPDPKSLSPEAVARILELEPMISAWLKHVKDSALADLLNGADVPGFKVVEGKQGNRKWSDELKVMQALEAAGVAREDYTTVELLSPAAMDKALGKKRAAELVGDLIDRAPGAPTVVPASDKRPKLDRVAQAKDDFKE